MVFPPPPHSPNLRLTGFPILAEPLLSRALLLLITVLCSVCQARSH